ncbi:hypothetical protein TTHERM_00561230 (macronuclear) [Tetrahymena thermophila SB210]|uniref:Uncharacterized protein n=1 Tax=Tetrahymena thermophila (strain SB210) TaxID=312017 RepID=I7M763_TETTS|nr:hypothetical protein TTHERM_00561230 [Tetrahymena thermophila SB210]EAR89932.2 hypothetical protein TTHERM_00561230 [Tetrahymena thermophila SB210]|eukprot:XP_001010177.2 hypothetical protein TTHERM_00561230 [Tetrahymena thermophila SB210]
MSATQKRNSDTDLFFIIESLTIYFEKILEIMDEPLKNYSKTEWFKFKELLTSPDLSPCKCFSYANSLKLVKPQPIVKVATFNLGDLGDQQSTVSQPQSNQQSVTQTPVLTLKKQEPSITVPSLISLSTVSPPNTFQKQYSFNTSKILNENKEQEQKKTKNSIINVQSLQQTSQPQIQQQNGNSSTQQNLLSPPPQTYLGAQSQPHFNYSNQISMNSISGSPSKIQSSAQTQTNISTTQAGKSSHNTSNQSSLGNNNYLNGGSSNNPSQNVKQIQQTLQNISSIGISSANQNQAVGSNRIHSISINSANNSSNLNFSSNQTNAHNAAAAGSNPNNNNSSSNNYAVDERLRSPQLNSSNQNGIYLSKTSSRNQATSASRLKNKNHISVSNISNLQVSSKKSPSQLEKLVSSTKVPQAHMKAQKSLQIDIKENSFQSRNNLQSNPSVMSSTSTRVDLSKINQNSIGNLLSTSKNLTGSPQYITSSTNYGNYNSHLLSSVGSSQNGYSSSASKGLTNNLSSKRFEGQSMTDRIRDKPQMNSIKTESVLIENSPPNHNNYTDNSSNGNFNNASPENKQNQNPLTFTSSTSNSILNLGLQQVPQNIVQIQQQVIQEQPQNESIGSPSNTPLTTAIGIEHPPIRKRARRETRKLSLEKFQNNIDAVQRQSELEENGITPILPLAHNKGYQQVLMNRLDILHSPNNHQEKKRDPSPVNNRIACDKIQGIHDFQKFKAEEDVVKENPYKHLLQKVQQRINVFLMDSKTLELISGKFTDVEETKRHREQANKQGAAVSFQSANNNVNGGVQERQEIKRDKLKKYSVFAKKGQDQQNLKKVDDQITKDELKLVNPLIKQRKRDEKKKLII